MVARSSGKAILLGEHAVVYGVPAIAVGLEKGATAIARRAEQPTIRVHNRRDGKDRTGIARDGSELGRGFGALLDAVSKGLDSVAVDVDLEIPPGVGLGASAVIAVATGRAVLELAEGGEPALDRVVDVAMAWERVFHGNPSGVDAWTAAHGGCVQFTRGSGIRPIHVARRIPLAIVVAGPPASTKVMVEGVARLREDRPEMVGESLAKIESLVKNAARCIETGDLIGLGKQLDDNQVQLSELRLSTAEIENACTWAKEAGALGAKLTGSGGGGCVIALAQENPEPIFAAWRAKGLKTYFASTVEADPTREGKA